MNTETTRIEIESGYYAELGSEDAYIYNRKGQYVGYYNLYKQSFESNSLSIIDIKNLAVILPMVHDKHYFQGICI